MPVGVWKVWNENGELKEEETYKDGFKTSVLDKTVASDDERGLKNARRRSAPMGPAIMRVWKIPEDSLKIQQSRKSRPTGTLRTILELEKK